MRLFIRHVHVYLAAVGKYPIEQYDVKNISISGVPLKVRRLVIENGDIQQLVYYWFQQRGRILTHEYMLKFYLFYDSIKMNRTDGALVRVVTTLKPGQDIEIADKRLQDFLTNIAPVLPEYVPK